MSAWRVIGDDVMCESASGVLVTIKTGAIIPMQNII